MNLKKKKLLENLSCRQRVRLLCEFLDKELPPKERKLVVNHRRSCRACSALLTSLTRTVATLQALRRTKTPAAAHRTLLAALRSR